MQNIGHKIMSYEKYIKKAETLVEAMPYINKFNGKTMVIKYGGSAMTDTL